MALIKKVIGLALLMFAGLMVVSAQEQVQTSLSQSAAYIVEQLTDTNQLNDSKRKMEELMSSFLLAGTIPEEDGNLSGDPGDADDLKARRRRDRDRRRRDDEKRRRRNRDRRQRDDDSRRSRNRYRRRGEDHHDDTTNI